MPLKPSDMKPLEGKIRNRRPGMPTRKLDHCVTALLQLLQLKGDEFAPVRLEDFVPDTANDFRVELEWLKTNGYLTEDRGTLTVNPKLVTLLEANRPLEPTKKTAKKVTR